MTKYLKSDLCDNTKIKSMHHGHRRKNNFALKP